MPRADPTGVALMGGDSVCATGGLEKLAEEIGERTLVDVGAAGYALNDPCDLEE